MEMVKQATPETDYIGFWHLRKAFEELFCFSDTNSTVARPNDFSNPAAYPLGVALPDVIEFLLDKLKFNNNDTNEVSTPKKGWPGGFADYLVL